MKTEASYVGAGEFTRDGKPADAPHRTVIFSASISIMAREVSVGEYNRCVADKACAPLTDGQTHSDLPAVAVSFNDAQVYAAWLSKRTGAHYRLPTDEEWTYAAGSRAPNDSPLGNADAVARWLNTDPSVQEAGFGQSVADHEAGMLRASPNEWTLRATGQRRSLRLGLRLGLGNWPVLRRPIGIRVVA